ncbi:MAG TPA: FliA/WhiG family RNA polymerase sigma factor [Bryobacteraceae bacterium]|nr:FliA/WhiG family RNA polymerase sigma factor [Bryobacteraceae bacterium]
MAAAPQALPPESSGPALRREALALRHLPQVRLIARRIYERLPESVSLDDLVSSGVLGLLAAIDNFDPSLGVTLGAYAESKIRGAILDGLRDADWAPRDVRKKSKQIEAAIARAGQRAGRDATEEEIAAELEIPLGEYHKWLTEARGVSLDSLDWNGGGSGAPGAQIAAGGVDACPWRRLERAELEGLLTRAIERMPKMERTVLHLYYFREMGLREIGDIVGMGTSRVGQLRTQGILRLRSHLERVWSAPARKGAAQGK